MPGRNLDCYEINSDMSRHLLALSLIFLDKSAGNAVWARQGISETYQKTNNFLVLSAKVQKATNKELMYRMKGR